MHQQGQVLKLQPRAPDGRPLWAFRYRTAGRDSKRVQRGGFTSKRDAQLALDRAWMTTIEQVAKDFGPDSRAVCMQYRYMIQSKCAATC